ncbi:MAG: hypothetical protein WCF06_08080, partial [Nitrososphaeraceae archaeon]
HRKMVYALCRRPELTEQLDRCHKSAQSLGQSVIKTTTQVYNKQEKFTSYLDPHYQFLIEQICVLLFPCNSDYLLLLALDVFVVLFSQRVIALVIVMMMMLC